MSYLVARISLEYEINKDQFRKQVKTALEFIKSKTQRQIIIAENENQQSLVFKSEYDVYIEINPKYPNVFFLPVIHIDTNLEQLIDTTTFNPEIHIKLTEPTLRKQDRTRRDLTILTERSLDEAVDEITKVLESEGIFYE